MFSLPLMRKLSTLHSPFSHFVVGKTNADVSISLCRLIFSGAEQLQNGKQNDGRVIQDIRMAIPHNRSL